MFVRVKSTPNSPRKSVQIVSSVRVGDKVKQKIMRHVGVAMNDEELENLKNLAEYLKVNLEAEHQTSLLSLEEAAETAIAARKAATDSEASPVNDMQVNLADLHEEQRTIVGIHEVFGKLYKEIGFSKLFHSESAHNMLYHAVMARIAKPESKRESVAMLERDFGVRLPLQKVYRMMDKFDDKAIAKLKKLSFELTKSTLNEKVNVLFYDCTTLYFESFTEDELKQNGYSKDLKFNQPQVILALIATQEGLPISYELFPGSMYEGHTLIQALTTLKSSYDVNDVIFVADSGLLNQDNLALLESYQLKYIVGARLKNLNTKLQEKLLSPENYSSITDPLNDRCVNVEYKKGQRLIVGFSDKRAKKDKHDRDKAIERLKAKLSKSKNIKSLLTNYGHKKYLEVQGESTLTINEERLAQDTKWDGLHGVITNMHEAEASEVLSQYRNLWQIEDCFRVNKHDLKIRPIYHWTPSRVQAHIAIAYMAFVCVKHLNYRVTLQYQKLSPEVIRKELLHVQVSILKNNKTGKKYGIPSATGGHAAKIYQTMGLSLSSTPFAIVDNSV